VSAAANPTAVTLLTLTMSESDDDDSEYFANNEPTLIKGWEHSTYAHATTDYAANRYSYIGKDEDGEPMWLDYGAKGSRNSVCSNGKSSYSNNYQEGGRANTGTMSSGNGKNASSSSSSNPSVIRGCGTTGYAHPPSRSEPYPYIRKDEHTRAPIGQSGYSRIDPGIGQPRTARGGGGGGVAEAINLSYRDQPRRAHLGTGTTVSSSSTGQPRTSRIGVVRSVPSASADVPECVGFAWRASHHTASSSSTRQPTSECIGFAPAASSSYTGDPRTAHIGTVKRASTKRSQPY